jgi:replicative DNA helicase
MLANSLFSLHDGSPLHAAVQRFLERDYDPLAYLSATNFVNLEECIGNGLHAGYLYTVVGSEGIGKTAFLLSLMCGPGIIARNQIVFISMQNSIDAVIMRLLIMLEGPDILRCMKKSGSEADPQDFRKLREAVSFLDDSGISLMDAEELTDPWDIIPKLYEIRNEIHPYLILIDGLDQYCKSRGQAGLAGTLSRCVRNLGVPVVISCGLKKSVTDRPDYKPQPCDYLWYELIRESDVVLDLFRPAYYDRRKDSIGKKASIRILKNAFGSCTTVPVQYDQDRMYWQE